jgi:hypothetical protein
MSISGIPQMLSTADAAERCSLGKSTLEKLRLTGGGPRFIKLGRRVIYHPNDLDDWLIAHRRNSTSDHGSSSGGQT